MKPEKDTVKVFWIRDIMIGIFPYWIGLSYRNPKPYYTIDLGYIKFMWVNHHKGGIGEVDAPKSYVDDTPSWKV